MKKITIETDVKRIDKEKLKEIKDRRRRYNEFEAQKRDNYYCRQAHAFIHSIACLNRSKNCNKYKSWNACEFCSRVEFLLEQKKSEDKADRNVRKIIPRTRKIIRRKK